MYLRTQCDLELYLSLFSNNKEKLIKANIPVPLKARPGVQIMTKSGKEFEQEQYDILINTFKNKVFHEDRGRKKIDLGSKLYNASQYDLFLEPEINVESFKASALKNIDLSNEETSLIPPMSDLRPDLIFVHPLDDKDFEILPNGTRKRVDTLLDDRLGLGIIDLKNIKEVNASYAAEVCLYAFFLSNWLKNQAPEIADKYCVTNRIYLWKNVELQNFKEANAEALNNEMLFKALFEDLEDGYVEYLVYMPSVRKFLKEDIPRVVKKGDLSGWDSLDYHVNSKCNACDWLGNKSWLSKEDKEHLNKHLNHYCFPSAIEDSHLSNLVNLSKGATKTLKSNDLGDITKLVHLEPSDEVLKKHSLLRKDKNNLSHRAQALISEESSKDEGLRISGLAKFFNAEYSICVNFDVSSGLLTGIGLRGFLLSPYEEFFTDPNNQQSSYKALGEHAFVVEKDSEIAEWATLRMFIDKLSYWIETTHNEFDSLGWGRPGTQICFWEKRQYDELCNAIGRHLLKIIALDNRYQRAIAFLFPSEELLEKESQLAPNIVMIKDVLEMSLRLPVRFENTLLNVAESYHHDGMKPRNVDNFYREPLSDAIPRERIYEIWKSATGTVRRFGSDIPISKAVEHYGNVLKTNVWSLSSISRRLREDLRDVLKDSKAKGIDMSIPSGLSNVAFDSKLWYRWDQISANTARVNGELDLLTKPEWLEASYKAIILKKIIEVKGNYHYVYEVNDESTESKLEVGNFFTLGIIDQPGFPFETCHSLGVDIEDRSNFLPLHKVINVRIIEFDRGNKTVEIIVEPSWNGVRPAFDSIFNNGIIPLNNESIYILNKLPPNDVETTRSILREIGNPSCSRISKETKLALGINAKGKSGTDSDTPIAKVLWEADKLATRKIRRDHEISQLYEFVNKTIQRQLNKSQQACLERCLQHQLSIIWGPPGTGKTDTLVAVLIALTLNVKGTKILICGPNYRTTEELTDRLLKELELQQEYPHDINLYYVYSKTRDAREVPKSGLNAKSVNCNLEDYDFLGLLEDIQDDETTTVVSTTSHVVHKITKELSTEDQLILPIYDVVVIDESSQVPVTLAMRPLSTLKDNGQLIIAGDHLQMPPINDLDPPKNAEYLVGSIQTYLIERFDIDQSELLVNYRSNGDLVDYAKTLGYPLGLQSSNKTLKLHQLNDLYDIVESLPPNYPKSIVYEQLLDPEKTVLTLLHEDEVSSQANEFEAKIVSGLVYCAFHGISSNLENGSNEKFPSFVNEDFFEKGIGIVTPHKAQKALVIKDLKALFPDVDPNLIHGCVDTVERFQGGERHTIIVSFGVGDTEIIQGEEAFLLQLERTNVAVSRAKAKVIVIMPKSLAYHLPTDPKAAKTSIALKSYIEEFCINKKSFGVEYDGSQRNTELRWH